MLYRMMKLMKRDEAARPLLLRAAQLLEGEAKTIRECHQVRGRWGRGAEHFGAKADHDEMISVARQLRALLPGASRK